MEDALIVELKQIIEQDKTFIGPEFLSYYARIVFGKKANADILARASLLAKDFKMFFNIVEIKERKVGVRFFNLSKIQNKIMHAIHKSFDSKKKFIDGDASLETFKSLILKDPDFESEEYVTTVNNMIVQEMLSQDTVSLIDSKFQNRRCIFEVLNKHQLLMEFINTGYKDAKTLQDYATKFNELITETLTETLPTNIYDTNLLLMSNQTFDNILNEEKVKEHISTGYKMLDYVLNGGLENGRLYVIGGISGGGKSLVVGNLAYNAKIALDETYETLTDKTNDTAVLYLTLENSAEETRFRIMCNALKNSKKQLLGAKFMGNTTKFQESYSRIFSAPNKTEFIVCWQPANSMDTNNLMFLINDLSRKYNKTIKMVVVDYADKLSPTGDSKTGTEYIDIGKIFDDLKNLAVVLDIPVLTVTQVNRQGYSKDGPSGQNVAGSMRKRDNTDVMLIFDFNSQEDEMVLEEDSLPTVKSEDFGRNTPIFCKIDKNRDGMKNVKLRMYVDYPTYTLKEHLDIPTDDYFSTESKQDEEQQEELPPLPSEKDVKPIVDEDIFF